MNHQATISRPRAFETPLARPWTMAFVALFLFVLTFSQIMAEEVAPKAATPPVAETHEAPRPSGRIQYVGPDTYILLDAEGRPQPVPGMTYEDFLAAWKKLNQPAHPEPQPRFVVHNIKIDGQTHGQRAELKLAADIQLLADGPVDIPLGLVGAIIQGEPRFVKPEAGKQKETKDGAQQKKEPDAEYLNYDPQHGGFVARMTGNAGDRRSLLFDLLVPLSRDGAETTLPLNCPRSVSSSLTLSVDGPITGVRTSNSAVITKKSTSDGGARVEVAGIAGQFRLTWQAANNDAASVASVLNAVGAINVSIDGRGVRSDARLTVSSFSGTFDQIRVRLPRGAKLIRNSAAAESQDPKYKFSEESTSVGSNRAPADAGQIVLVELKEKQSGPVIINLSTEQPGNDGGQAIELGGFEVIGAIRQFGDIALNVATDWQTRWNIGREVRQVDPSEVDASLKRSELTAAFQYDRQPWSLGVRVSPRQSRVHVTPQYDLELLPEDARLTIKLTYQNFGARAFEFRVEMDGWELTGEPVESGGLVDQDRVAVTPKGTLILPLAQASSRKAEVSFSVRRALQRNADKINLPLPVPLADSVGTGTLTVRVPAETELLPDLTNSTGLAVSPTSEAITPIAEGAGTQLHFRSLLPNAVFVANRSNRSREISAHATTQVEIASDSTQVQQRVEYAVRYEPIKELVFEAANDLPIDDEGTEIALLSAGPSTELAEQRAPLTLEPVTDENDLATTETRRFRAILPQSRVGKFTIAIRYRIERLQPFSADGTVTIPLLSAVDARETHDRATVRTPKGLFASLNTKSNSSAWKAISLQRNRNSLASDIEFVSDHSELVLPLVVGSVDVSAPSPTVVERVWLQTWISGGIEQDRSAFRLRTASTQTTVELPPFALLSGVEVLVDGRPAEVSSRAAGRIVVRLPSNTGAAADTADPELATHTLELRFRRPIHQSLITRHRFTPPQIDGSTELSQVYWQIILPADEHIIRSPGQLVSASQWQWLGSFWGRQAAMRQADLEKWIAASPQAAPPTGTNQYLFSGLLPVSSIELVTAPRWLIVLLASLTVLLILACWYYLPLRVRSWLLVVVVIVIAFSAVAFPTPALLIAQASAIGVVLTVLSVLISRIMARPGRRSIVPVITSSTHRTITPRTDSIIMPPVIAAASTAPTATLRSSDSER